MVSYRTRLKNICIDFHTQLTGRARLLTLIMAFAIFQCLPAQDDEDSFGSVDYYHPKIVDKDNHLDSWHKDENGPFEFILNLSASWWKNAPEVNGWPIWCTAALVDDKYLQGAGAIPGSACSFAIMACLRYYVHTGDTSFLRFAIRTGEYIILQTLTPSDFKCYPNFPYAVGKTGDTNPQGTGHPNDIDNVNLPYSIMPDKGAMLGVALLELYKVTGRNEFLAVSLQIANCLSDNAVEGNENVSPWPMRVMADDGSTVDGIFSANVSFACRLFDDLQNIGQNGNGKYKITRDAVWKWLKENVIAYDDGSRWFHFFEDHSGEEINSTQINALETVRYLLEKKNLADTDWFALSEKIINQVTRRWSVTTIENDGFVSIAEQDSDQSPYNSHTARYGSILSMFLEAGANSAYKDTAYHSLCYSLYSVEDDGFTNTYFKEGGYAWTTDSFGDFLYHFMEALAAVPEWSGNRNYLLKSTSVVKRIIYSDTSKVSFSTFERTGKDKLKLKSQPYSVKVDGRKITSYNWDNTTKVLIINRSTGNNVEVSLIKDDVAIIPPEVTTAQISSVTSYDAVCGGAVTDDGGSDVISRGVCWNNSGNPTIADHKTTDGSGTGSFTSHLTGLNPDTKYYLRAYATNSAGTSYGDQISFVTAKAIVYPSVSTSAVTEITETSAICGGTVISSGGSDVIERGVCWSTDQNPTIYDARTNDGSGTGSFESILTGLSSGTEYHVRAYATNAAGTGYGETLTFTTLVTGINETTLQEIRIFPNPSGGIFTLSVDRTLVPLINIEIFDLNGRIVFTIAPECESTHNFDLGHFQKGIYIIKLHGTNHQYSARLVIQ